MYQVILIVLMLISVSLESKGNEISSGILKLEENFSACDAKLDNLTSFCDENSENKKCQNASLQTSYSFLYSENLSCYQKIMNVLIHDFYSVDFENYFNNYTNSVHHFYREVYQNTSYCKKKAEQKNLWVLHNISFDIHNLIENILYNLKFKQTASSEDMKQKTLPQKTSDMQSSFHLKECNEKINEKITYCSNEDNFNKSECSSLQAIEQQIKMAAEARICYQSVFSQIAQTYYSLEYQQLMNIYDEYVAETVKIYDKFYFSENNISQNYGLADILGTELKINTQIYAMIDNLINNINNNCQN